MHQTTDISPVTIRLAVVTAAATVAMLTLGLVPLPHLFLVLTVCVVTGVVALITGPKATGAIMNLPVSVLVGIAVLTTLGLRGTSLVWAVVPVLAGVVAALTWMVLSARYDDGVASQPGNDAVADELEPKRQEKTAAATDDSSATAA